MSVTIPLFLRVTHHEALYISLPPLCFHLSRSGNAINFAIEIVSDENER